MIKNFKISFKITALTIIIIVSLSIAFIVAFKVIQDTLLDVNSKGTYEVVNQTTNNLENVLEEIEELAVKMSKDDEIAQRAVKMDAAKDVAEANRYQGEIKLLLDNYVSSNMDIEAAVVITPKNNTAASGQQSVASEQVVKDIPTIKNFRDSKSKSMWLSTYFQDMDLPGGRASDKVITLIKSMYSSTSLNSIGTLVLYMRESLIGNEINEVSLTNKGEFYVVGERDNLAYNVNDIGNNANILKFISEAETKKFRYVSEDTLNKIKQANQDGSGENVFREIVNGEECVVTYSKIDKVAGTPLGWTIISVTKTADIFENINKIMRQVIILSIVCMIIGLLAAFYISRDITKAFKKLMGKMDEVKKGNLDIEFKLDRKDEIGYLERSFENMVRSLKELISKIRSASTISIDSSQTLSASCEENYASIEELNSLLQILTEDFHKQSGNIVLGKNEVGEIKEKIGRTKSNIEITDEIIIKSRQLSDLNKNSVSLLYNMSDNIKKAMDNISMEFKELIIASSEIGKITQSITRISDQTKLLALNASIESAKAGVYGKSFALVAEEIKKLSVQSKEFVSNIDIKVKNIVGKIEKAGTSVTSLNGVVKESESTITSVVDSFDNNLSFLNNIVSQIENIKDSINSIETSGNDIITIIESISGSIESDIDYIDNINTTTSDQLKMVEQLVKKSEELSSIAYDLEGVVNNFQM
ncbi:methyl-accepting chemotaxis protein [Acetivibrio cellulolyticus]|uniref:methyl-accepting chemotaxis protein n=1 Tax=Acetivibrio cellulolyticus TaxID=35830 RepID=UPI0001E301C6|nr:methyl-accepting chemotaxis protein [Acetivibrio cellulolyticus]